MNTFKRITATLLAFIFINSAFAYNKQDLMNAIKANSNSQIKKILTVSPNLSTLKYDSDGNSSLMVAILNKCSDKIIDMLLDAGCSPDLKNKSGQTALMLACNYGYSEKTIKKIINYNVLTKGGRVKRILLKDDSGKCAFDYAKGNSQCYDALLDYTADPATIQKEPEPAVPQPEAAPVPEVPAEAAQEETVEETSEKAEEIVEEPSNTEEAAEPVEEKAEEVQKALEETAAEEPSETQPETAKTADLLPEESAQEAAAETTTQAEIKEAPLESLVTAESSETALAVTETIEDSSSEPAENNNEEIAAVEVNEEIKENTETQTAAEETKDITAEVKVPAIDYYNSKRPEYLFDEIETEILVEETSLAEIKEAKVRVIDNPDSVDNVGRTRLMNAIMANDEKLCYTLLYSGADANAKDKDGWTPLMYACRYAKSSALIQLLFEYKAKVNAKSNYNVSVLQVAAIHCSSPTILNEVLTQAVKEKLNIQEAFISALTEERSEEIIYEFLKFKINVNSLYKGKTPLMYAAGYYESTGVIKLLLDKGADPYIISSENKNAFSYAKENTKILHDSVYWSLNVSSAKKR